MPGTLRLVLTALFMVLIGLPAAAEYGPGDLPQPGQGDINNPAPAIAGQAMAVPDYIKPGFEMTFMGGSSTELTDGVKSGMGFTVYSVLAVLNDKVLVSATNYLTPNGLPLNADGSFDYDSDPKAQLTGSDNSIINNADVISSEALWMPVEQLKQWKKTDKFEVWQRTKEYRGKVVNATTIGYKDNDIAYINTFHADNGMKLETISNYKEGKQYSQMQLLSTKQIDSPLVGAKWPDWAKTVKKMSYKGTYNMVVPGVDPIPLQITSEVVFKQRGEGWVIGKSSMTTDGQASGSSHVMQGPGTMLGYWVHPEILANLDAGVVYENEIIRIKTTYQIQNGRLGRLGVFVITNDAQTFYAVSAYNLENGALTYINLYTASPGTNIEFTLDGIETQ